MLVFGAPALLSSGIGVFLTYINTLFLTFFRTLPEVGLYNVALPTAGLLWFVGGVLYSVMLPLASQMRAKRQQGVLEMGLGRMYLYLFVLILPFTAVLLLFPDLILNALFGAEYLGAARSLQLLVIGGVFYTLSQLNAGVLIGLGEPKRILSSLAWAAVVNLLLGLLLIPRFGMDGSSFATLVAFFVLFVLNLRALRGCIAVRLPLLRIAGAIVAAMLFTLCVWWLRTLLVLPLWGKLAVGGAIGFLLYIVALFALRVLSFDEFRDIRKLL
jgi:O-antigen/teichoic acid export membrane protein